MLPYLFEFTYHGTLVKVPTYGVMLAIAFSSGYFLALWRASRLGENTRHVENIFLISIAGAVIGARLFHVVFEDFAFYRSSPAKIFAIWEGGYTFYGGVLAAMAGIFLYCRWRKIDFLTYADIATPTTALGLMIGRIGCFAAGCCWGRPTTCALGVTFNHPDSFSLVKGIPVHPTQLYESFGALLIFVYVSWLFPRRRYPGQILFHGLAVYAVVRFVVEIFRGDDYRGYLFQGALSTSQFISLGILAVVAVAIARFRNRTAAPRKAASL